MPTKQQTAAAPASSISRLLNIGEASEATGVSAKMIRHYEAIGLIPPAKRTESNYRLYTENDVHTLRFIKQARNVGFPIEQIGDLLKLWRNRRRPSREVKQLVAKHLAELDVRIHELEAMKNALEALAHQCHGDDRPECPILDGLEHPAGPAAGSRRAARGLK